MSLGALHRAKSSKMLSLDAFYERLSWGRCLTRRRGKLTRAFLAKAEYEPGTTQGPVRIDKINHHRTGEPNEVDLRCDKRSAERDVMASDSSAPDVRTIESELGAELLKIREDSYGKGAAATRVLVDGDAIVVFFDDLELQQNERLLIEGGFADSVLTQRSDFQRAIEPVFRAAVERVSGWRVISFASITKLEPNYSVEIFRVAPRQISGEPGGR
jgi:uncharacterized protein YbcI